MTTNITPSHRPGVQTAVVTGAAGAFGQAMIKQLLEQGFFVAATDISQTGLNTLKELAVHPERMKTFQMDVADRQSVSDAAGDITTAFSSPVSVLINNAGIFMDNPIFMPESSDIAKKVVEINLIGAMNCVSVFARLMVKNKFGRIINIASTAGIMGAGGASAYAASKGGLIAATKSWARELGHFGITVNAIAPGICQSPMMRKEDRESAVKKLMTPLIPVRRLGNPFDVAEAAGFLAACKTNYVNGEILTLDGGLYTGTIDSETVIG